MLKRLGLQAFFRVFHVLASSSPSFVSNIVLVCTRPLPRLLENVCALYSMQCTFNDLCCEIFFHKGFFFVFFTLSNNTFDMFLFLTALIRFKAGRVKARWNDPLCYSPPRHSRFPFRSALIGLSRSAHRRGAKKRKGAPAWPFCSCMKQKQQGDGEQPAHMRRCTENLHSFMSLPIES